MARSASVVLVEKRIILLCGGEGEESTEIMQRRGLGLYRLGIIMVRCVGEFI